MRIRPAYDRGFGHGFQLAHRQVADAAVHAATHAQAATTAGQQWLADLATHARQLGRPTASTKPPMEADRLRTPPAHVQALTRHLPPAQARQAAHQYGIADGRIAAVAATGQDLYRTALRNLGSLRPAIDGRQAHLWLETARARWRDIAARGAAPTPGSQAALARQTLLGAAAPTEATPPPPRSATRSAQQAARPAPATPPPPGGQATATPAPARGVARVPRPAPRR